MSLNLPSFGLAALDTSEVLRQMEASQVVHHRVHAFLLLFLTLFFSCYVLHEVQRQGSTHNSSRSLVIVQQGLVDLEINVLLRYSSTFKS